jgi:hypothetical protein
MEHRYGYQQASILYLAFGLSHRWFLTHPPSHFLQEIGKQLLAERVKGLKRASFI